MAQSNPKPATAAVDDLTERAATQADGAIASTRQVANDALDSLQAGVNTLRGEGPGALSRATAQIETLARRSLDRARDAGHQVQDQARRAGERGVDYVRDEPVKSVLIAAATGAAVAALVGWLVQSRRRQG